MPDLRKSHIGGNMKAHPILFSTPMVQALLDGRKTQTRRILKGSREFKGPYSEKYMERYKNHEGWSTICPYGSPGELLWCRETYAESVEPENHEHARAGYTYRADWDFHDDCEIRDFPWKPSIFMPRAASRLTLEISEVRVQRLQEITERDAYAEGCNDEGHPYISPFGGRAVINNYAALWDSINGSGSWKRNEFVWVLSFTVHKQNVDEFLKGRAA